MTNSALILVSVALIMSELALESLLTLVYVCSEPALKNLSFHYFVTVEMSILPLPLLSTALYRLSKLALSALKKLLSSALKQA